eukprot:TRINITY_DN2381_c0_g1_i1.p1 TRINITY_DN2381_c0_g1~~TRINITY_DN2381_c0_g1_i1.p1  ORF type:complete len:347 (-),score=52.25 TRINITY_DN2381_c0_g1_i1:398-1438(-)
MTDPAPDPQSSSESESDCKRGKRTRSFVVAPKPVFPPGRIRTHTGHLPEDQDQELKKEDVVVRYGLHSVQGHRREMEDDHKLVVKGYCEPQAAEGADEEILWTAPMEDVAFFGVYDGHGGTECATFLRTHLHRAVLQHSCLLEDPERALREGIAQTEQLFLKFAAERGTDSGSTCAVVLIVGNKLVAANVGDSEVVLNRGGKPLVLTTIHNMFKNDQEEARVKEAGGTVYHKRLGHPMFNPQVISIAVSRSIGDWFFKNPQYTEGKPSGLIADSDTKVITLTNSDFFVIMGCDGLWDVMTYQHAINFVDEKLQEGKEPQQICEELTAEALRKGSTDNITVLLIGLT